jgi:serine/threonine protein kinase
MYEERIESNSPDEMGARALAIRHSKSSPGLSHRLSHKLSTALIHPTVVHRPDLKSRPSVKSIQSEVALAKAVSTSINADQPDSSDPLTPPTGGSGNTGPQNNQSTGKTSISSEATDAHSVLAKLPSDLTVAKSKSTPMLRESDIKKPLTPIKEIAPVTLPSIVTVETTATAKIFFETYFNSIYAAEGDSRARRRRELDQSLNSKPLSQEGRLEELRKWTKSETDHLRRLRVMKACALVSTPGKNLSVAGYELVKILGKGSFGVVRLVREKFSHGSDPSTDGPGPSYGDILESSKAKPNAMKALKTTMDAHRSSRKRKGKSAKRQVYAMKVIRKAEMLRNSQEGHLRAERDFLVASEGSRWIVPLIASFQDHAHLYLVMEYMVGGDFLGLLIRKQVLNEDITRWYIAEMVLCIEEAHSLNWIHRDVKPDNFLISASGHLKISDFGLAFDGHWAHDQNYYNNQRHSLMNTLGVKIGGDQKDREEDLMLRVPHEMAKTDSSKAQKSKPREDLGEEKHHLDIETDEKLLDWRNRTGFRGLAKSVVGTSQYMAPEVVKGQMYDGRCDWWSLGIILFEVGVSDSGRNRRLTRCRSAYTAILHLAVRIDKRPRKRFWYR